MSCCSDDLSIKQQTLTHFSDEEVLYRQHHLVRTQTAQNNELLEETERLVVTPLAREPALLG